MGGSERVRVPPLVAFFLCFEAFSSSNKFATMCHDVPSIFPPNLTMKYLWKSHFSFSRSVGWPSPVQNTEGAWLALLMGVYAVWILFKLDLYMKREQRCGFLKQKMVVRGSFKCQPFFFFEGGVMKT